MSAPTMGLMTFTTPVVPSARVREAINLDSGAVQVRGYSLEEIWDIAHQETFVHEDVSYVPMLSFIEEGPEGEPVLYLSRPHA